MKELMVCKSLSMVCLIEAFVLVECRFVDIWPYLLAIMLGTVVGADISYCLQEKGILRYVPMVLPGMAVFFTQNLFLQLYVSVVIIYLMLVAYGNLYDVEYQTYRRAFGIMLLIAGGLTILFMFLVSFVQRSDRVEPYAILIAHVLLGSYVLRQARLGIEKDGREKVLNVVLLVGVVGMAVFLTGIIKILLMLDAGEIISFLLLPIGILLNLVTQLFMKAGTPLGKKVHKLEEENIMHKKIIDKVKVGESRFKQPKRTSNVPEMNDNWLLAFGIALAVLVVLAIVVFIYYKLRDRYHFRSRVAGVRGFTFERLESMPRKAKRGHGNREKIRNSYSNCLRKGKQNGYVFYECDTSADVQERMERYGHTKEKNDRLREAYIRVRYKEDYNPTGEEVRQVRELVRELKSEMRK
ncbi:MAG: hypothetical protein E7277_01900 [Lachnospiraceae bacterium]|jgi:hypothetical protein|nr:hypothetical protein [Lachnospiraceae bacterium]